VIITGTLIRSAIPYIGGAALGIWLVLAVYDKGKDDERAKWQAREVAAQEAQRARENALQAQVDAAGAALSMSTAENERLARIASVNRSKFYEANPTAAGPCLHVDRVRAIQAGDEAANAAIAAR
jgi:hypothetical protein